MLEILNEALPGRTLRSFIQMATTNDHVAGGLEFENKVSVKV